MVRCECLKLDGQQCTRNGSTKKQQNPKFCWQHQNCQDVVTKTPTKQNQVDVVTKTPIKNNQVGVVTKTPTKKNQVGAGTPTKKNQVGVGTKTPAKKNQVSVGTKTTTKQSQVITRNASTNKILRSPFSGSRAIDKIILLSVPDHDLRNLLQINSYFHTFYDYEPLWREKILKEFGVGHIKTYTGSNWRQYYMSLRRYANIYKISGGVDWLAWFDENGYKLHYGDIVVRDDIRTIYDGQQLIEFEAKFESRDKTIPQSFYVLSENHGFVFPVDYWKNAKPEIKILWLKTADLTFTPSQYVYLPNDKNDFYDDNDATDIVYTKFAVNSVNYTLEYESGSGMDTDDVKYFDKLLVIFEYVPIQIPNFLTHKRDHITGIHLVLDADLLYQLNTDLYESVYDE